MRKLFIALLSALLCLPLSVSALAKDGLSTFRETQAYQSGMFSDVKAGSWYESGVRAVYTRGIMNGTGEKAFAPNQTITWAQAAAVAARIHAACGGAEIAAAEGQWYEPYLAYAAQAKLLPSTCPEGAAVASTTIARQELAGLFANVLSADKLPAINDQSIPDLGAVDAEFRAAVQRMYAAGVFAGKDGGRFDPKGSATRAEIAVIVSRLLLPAQRVSHDSRVNTAMSAQMGNYYQGSLAVQSGDTVYYAYRSDDADAVGVVGRKADGSTETLFTSDRVPDNLYLDENGAFYFLWWEKLLRYDPAVNKLEEVYAAKGKIDSFQIYDGRLYVLENYSGDSNYPDQWRYRFGCVENGQFRNLMDGITFDQVLYMDRFHIFNNKAYFLFGDNTELSSSGSGHVFYNYALWSIDLETGQKGRVVDIDHFDMGEIAFDGATAYALEWDKDETVPLRIVRFSLLQPELREVMATFPIEAKELYPLLFANGGELYYLSSGAHRLWHISPSGEVTVASQIPWNDHTFEQAAVTPQGILFHDETTLRATDSSRFKVRQPDGSVVNCLDFLGLQ